MSFFDTQKPYEIAKGITHGNELYNDLVAYVYLIMIKKKGVESEEKYFSRCALIQWNKPNSEFNRQYRPYYTTEINEEITKDYTDEWYTTKYKAFLREYIDKQPSGESSVEWYKRQIVKFILRGMTQQQITKEYGIPQPYVSYILKQFKEDVRNNYIKRFGSKDFDNV